MARVIISSWKPGLQTIKMVKLIQQYALLGLKDAKSCVDRVLDNEQVTLTIGSENQARQLAEQLKELGATAELDDTDTAQ